MCQKAAYFIHIRTKIIVFKQQWQFYICWVSRLLFSFDFRYESIQKRGVEREPVSYKPGDVVYGFQCTNVRPVPELSLTAYQFVHQRTKADYVHLDCADTDNAFR